MAGLFLWVAAASLFWVFSVASLPAADSARVVTAAADAAAGRFGTLQAHDSYFRMFPFQLGYVAIAEILLRLFGGEPWRVLAVANVAALLALYAAILKMTRQLFASRRVTLAVILLLAACLQPILFCTFQYGNLMGLAAALWAASLTLDFLRGGRRRLLVPLALLGAFSVLAKMNNWIVILAIGIVLLLDALRRRRRFGLVIAAALLLVCLAVPRLTVTLYERRAGVTLGPGTPQAAWLAMGLQESTRAPGWFNHYTYGILPDSDYSVPEASARIAADIRERLAELKANPRYAVSFFGKKVLSQWNEPTFESLWVSQVKRHADPVPAWVESVYSGPAGVLLTVWFDIHLQLLYLGAAAGILNRLKRASPEAALDAALPVLIFLGAFGYHLLFEAKSQYALVYLPLLAPFAGLGLITLGEALAGWLARMDTHRRAGVSRPLTGR